MLWGSRIQAQEIMRKKQQLLPSSNVEGKAARPSLLIWINNERHSTRVECRHLLARE